MSVKAVVLAAGSGARLRPLSPFIPKEMLPIGHFPVMHYVLDEIASVAVREVMVVLSDEKRALYDYCTSHISPKGEDAKRYSEERARLLDRLDISFAYQRVPKGTGDAIAMARDFMGNDPLLVIYPDDLLPRKSGDIPVTRRMIDEAVRSDKSVILTEEIPLSAASSYGVVDLGEEKGLDLYTVRGIIEKPRHYQGTRAFAMIGRMVVTPSLVRSIPDLPISDDSGVIPALDLQADRGRLVALRHRGVRLDVGSHEGYLKASEYYRRRE